MNNKLPKVQVHKLTPMQTYVHQLHTLFHPNHFPTTLFRIYRCMSSIASKKINNLKT